MNQTHIRRILLAKAIESQPAENALVSEAQREAATQNALYEVRPSDSGNAPIATRLHALFDTRSRMVVEQALDKAPSLASLLQTGRVSTWAYALIPVVALALGFAMDRIADPHRINVLSGPLLGILAWNLLAYAVGIAWLLWRAVAPSRNALPVNAAHGFWRQPVSQAFSRLRHLGSKERKVTQAFWQDWLQFSQPLHKLRMQRSLHLGAAAVSLGVIASLWFTGLFTEYRVGWESTFLDANQVQRILNTLTYPAQHMMGLAPWSLHEVQLLQTWPEGNGHAGARWVQTYSILLALLVIAPRLLLAAIAHWRARRVLRKTQLPLQAPYFQALVRDFSSDAISVQIQPYSLHINDARRTALLAYAHAIYGSAVHSVVLPSMLYGKEPPGHRPHADSPGTIHVLLFNLAATPERETQGEAILQLAAHPGSQQAVWLLGGDYAERLGNDNDGRMRLAERKRLWQTFVQGYGLKVEFVDC